MHEIVTVTDFNHQTDLTVRQRDLDTQAHVSNAVYATYLEQARNQYFADVLDVPLHEAETAIVMLKTEFKLPVQREDDLTIATRVGELGGSSIPFKSEVRANGDLAATGEVVLVTWDSEAGNTQPLPDEWREKIQEFEGRS